MQHFAFRLCGRLLAALPVDPAGRRTFDETLADWQREQRVLLGAVAVLRAVTLVAVREARWESMGGFVRRTIGWSIAWVAVTLALGQAVGSWTTIRPQALVSWSILGAGSFLPAALLLASLARRHHATLGSAVSAAVLATVLTGWVLPATSRVAFPGVISPEQWTWKPSESLGVSATLLNAWPTVPTKFFGKQSQGQLMAQVMSGPPDGWFAMEQLSFRASFVALCALMPFAGLLLREHGRAVSVVGTGMVLTLVLYQARVDALIAPDWVFWMFVSSWVPVLAVFVVCAGGPARTLRG